MPVSYLKDAEQTEPWTLPLARALLIDILTIWTGFYGYLLYFECMFALVCKQVCERNRVWLAVVAQGWKMTSGTRWFDFLFFFVGGTVTREALSCVTCGCLFKTSVMTVLSYSCCPRGEFCPVRLMLSCCINQKTTRSACWIEQHPG